VVIIDKFSKYTHFHPMAHPFNALQVAQTYFARVYRLHGLPQVIISDSDRIFMSNLWQKLFKLFDIQLIMNSSYHPQMDGQIEKTEPMPRNVFMMCYARIAEQVVPMASLSRVLVQYYISYGTGSFSIRGTLWPHLMRTSLCRIQQLLLLRYRDQLRDHEHNNYVIR
jgi:hypothetical protein